MGKSIHGIHHKGENHETKTKKQSPPQCFNRVPIRNVSGSIRATNHKHDSSGKLSVGHLFRWTDEETKQNEESLKTSLTIKTLLGGFFRLSTKSTSFFV